MRTNHDAWQPGALLKQNDSGLAALHWTFFRQRTITNDNNNFAGGFQYFMGVKRLCDGYRSHGQTNMLELAR